MTVVTLCMNAMMTVLTACFLAVSLIELLREVLDAEQVLFNKRVKPLDEWLKKYLRVSCCTQLSLPSIILSSLPTSLLNRVGLCYGMRGERRSFLMRSSATIMLLPLC